MKEQLPLKYQYMLSTLNLFDAAFVLNEARSRDENQNHITIKAKWCKLILQ